MKKTVCIMLATLLTVTSPIQIAATTTPKDYTDPDSPQVIRATVYTADEGAITRSGQSVREGIIAGKEEWLGMTAMLYSVNSDGTIGEFLGYYEFLDTGAGVDTDGDGKGDSIKNGTSIDVFRNSDERVNEWLSTVGDYVYMVIIPEAVG